LVGVRLGGGWLGCFGMCVDRDLGGVVAMWGVSCFVFSVGGRGGLWGGVCGVVVRLLLVGGGLGCVVLCFVLVRSCIRARVGFVGRLLSTLGGGCSGEAVGCWRRGVGVEGVRCCEWWLVGWCRVCVCWGVSACGLLGAGVMVWCGGGVGVGGGGGGWGREWEVLLQVTGGMAGRRVLVAVGGGGGVVGGVLCLDLARAVFVFSVCFGFAVVGSFRA